MPEANEESITTVPLLPEAENISLSDILYLIQGVGADRDRKMTLAQLRDVLQNNFTSLKIKNTYIWNIVAYASGTFEGCLDIGLNMLTVPSSYVLLPKTKFYGETLFKEPVNAEKKVTWNICEVGSFYQKTSSIIKCSASSNPTLPNGETDGRRLLVVNDTSSGQTITYGSSTLYLNGGDAAEFIKVGSNWYAIRNG